jgi:tripartite-type tricarboxylate transporter receptor subunit TctC
MRITSLIPLATSVLAALSLVGTARAAGPDFPTGQVRFIVPFAPGGSADQIARPLAQKLQQMWGKTVVVDNRPGAGTVIGTDLVAKSAPDGHTFGLVVAGHMINPSMKRSLPYNTRKDIAGITQLTAQQMALVANPNVPFNNVQELIAHAKANPGKVTYGSAGQGTAHHMSGELFDRHAGTKMVHVAYKGASLAYNDLLAGHIDTLFEVMSSALPFVNAGKLKIIALTGAERNPNFKQYPVIAETVPNFRVDSIFGLIAPSATPPAVLNRIQSDVAKVLFTPEFKKLLADGGMEPVGSTHEEFDRFINSEIDRWADLIKANNIKPE